MYADNGQKETIEELAFWIEESNPTEISAWIDGILREDTWHYPVELRRSTPEEVLLAVYRYSNDVAFHYKLKEALTLVAYSVSWKHGAPDYLSNLLASMGYLNARPGYDLLVQLGLKRTLVKRWLRPGVSLHKYLLASLAGMGCDSRSIHIFVRDINVPEYAGICFRAVWSYDPMIAIDVSDIVAKIGAEHPHFPTHLLFKEMVSHLSLSLVWNLVDRVLTSERLNDKEKVHFATYVRGGKLGFGLKTHSSWLELVRLGVDECLPVKYREVKPEILRHLTASWLVNDYTAVLGEGPPEISLWDLPPFFQNHENLLDDLVIH